MRRRPPRSTRTVSLFPDPTLFLSQFLEAIADVDAPQTRHPVEDAMAIAVVDIAALGMGDDAAAAQAFDFGPVDLRGQMVRDVEAAQFGDVVIAGHNLEIGRASCRERVCQYV